ncbi:MAG: tRNA dihydrouridine synthase DusB [Gammaproteobacteria bacterium]
MKIGRYQLTNNLILAPMAGITDRPFREISKRFGAGLTVSEMVASNPALRTHKKTLLKADHAGESGLRSVQIVGTDPKQMADAARFNAERGAHIIDINMGCPARKVCSVSAGSALLKDESLVGNILEAVVNAVDIPVTLKIRTGWDLENRNAATIARIAETSGISALAVHGRSRACKFNGDAEYDTIKQVKESVSIPVIANGDIDSADKAKCVLEATGADAVMIGRAALGNPWIFKQIGDFLKEGKKTENPSNIMITKTILDHLEKLYSFYGNLNGVRIARKHIGWYLDTVSSINQAARIAIYQASAPSEQLKLVSAALDILI